MFSQTVGFITDGGYGTSSDHNDGGDQAGGNGNLAVTLAYLIC